MLKGLKFLNVSGYTSLKGFPDEGGSLDSLEVILGYNFYSSFIEGEHFGSGDAPLRDYPKLEFSHLPESIGSLVCLLTLVLHGGQVTRLQSPLVGFQDSAIYRCAIV